MKIKTYADIAQIISKESKCIGKQVGCVIAKDGEVISTGYNGTAPGFINCCDAHSTGKFTREEHHEWSKKYETHAELSAILRSKVDTTGSVAVITLSPCFNCVKHLVTAGIKSIYFLEKYDRLSKEEFKEIKEYCIARSVGLVELTNTWFYHTIGQFEAERLFTYDGETLYWRERDRSEMKSLKTWATWNGKHAGNIFGAIHGEHKASYRRGTVSGKLYLAHRLVWLLSYGSWPVGILDHQDGEGLNNSLTNLIESTTIENLRNMPLRGDNTSGYQGVNQLPSGNWKVTHRNTYQGVRPTFASAVAFKRDLEKEDNFSENHGRTKELSCQTREEFQQSHRHEGQKEGCETRGT